mmetsp:Transcript_33551/g.48596  ORF Transcript_33551/g.48596 Transcript_33551/m.48596 type:complete len:94 (-) Transcript_33551:574-855(-)
MLTQITSRAGRSVASKMQRRNAGGGFSPGMWAKKNKFVEEWNGRREITEKSFELNNKTVPTLIMTCLLFPAFVWKTTAHELHKTGGPSFQDTC